MFFMLSRYRRVSSASSYAEEIRRLCAIGTPAFGSPVGFLPHSPRPVSGVHCAVPIKNITRGEFNGLLPHHLVLENLMGQQVAWFADKAKNFIGTIASAKAGRSWNFAVLRRNKLGNFQVCDIGENFFNLAQTIVQFRHAMVAAKNGRQFVCPSSD